MDGILKNRVIVENRVYGFLKIFGHLEYHIFDALALELENLVVVLHSGPGSPQQLQSHLLVLKHGSNLALLGKVGHLVSVREKEVSLEPCHILGGDVAFLVVNKDRSSFY